MLTADSHHGSLAPLPTDMTSILTPTCWRRPGVMVAPAISGSGAGGSGTSGYGVGANIAGTATIADGSSIVSSYARGGDGSSGGNADARTSSIDIDGTLTAGERFRQVLKRTAAMAISALADTVKGRHVSNSVYGTLEAGTMVVANRGTGGNGVTAGGDAWGGSSTGIRMAWRKPLQRAIS